VQGAEQAAGSGAELALGLARTAGASPECPLACSARARPRLDKPVEMTDPCRRKPA